ncbi:hypothetical protein L3556_14875 [Candidatus Synechococcus calcipolaris G9]|uniref:Uncharacterized protein n=1 Tax=Candidatus Synechococcus calcipolaris G9 TaxID=1497997 RepID=A0ABT6F2V4_9SYNE|nr:hypothetical protein [Candidatus Synechococcus calcipolaris]MDG2992201.1 hypothetical protein [Candidatus Synechococcus calcipolaris G9]
MGRSLGRYQRFVGCLVLGILAAFFALFLGHTEPLILGKPAAVSVAQTAPVFANPRQVAGEIYAKLPNFPLENTYIRQETNQVASESTLIERLIVYHTTVKGRSPVYRLDWKITLGDFLGVNDFLQGSTYPGTSYLKENPMAGDMAVIQALNRQERQQLIQTLVNYYSPLAGIPLESPQQPSRPMVEPDVVTPQLPPASQPGEAQLLSPRQEPRPTPTGDARFLLP